ncbi:MAG: cysteine desulfurase NifS [Candidatus Firestonebacteria bacterium]
MNNITKKRIYMDCAATTPVHPDVVQAMLPFFTENFGNPSTVHSFGREAKSAMEEAREKLANAIFAKPEEIVFTSGGTEADNFAIKGVAYFDKNKGGHIITSKIEHHAVLETCHFLEKNGFTITYLPVDEYGTVNPEDVQKAITDKTILISIMHANNEIGTIEPIAEIGKIARKHNITFHSDAVQTLGSIPVNVDELNVDMLSFSAHKLYGPKGIGAIYIRKGTKMVSFLHGGEQERRRRAGTENVPYIVGFGKAVEIAISELVQKRENLTCLRDKLTNRILTEIEQTKLNGHPTAKLPGHINVTIKHIEGESMVLNLDMEGIAASTGSACSSGSLEASHVLTSIGVAPEDARSSLRLTLGRQTTEDNINKVADILKKVITRLRAISPLYKKR